MAEGGMAAAMAHNDDRDSWKVHFADTMRGGQYVNNWRMAELHAKEAPDRVRELEGWGAVFDRTPDGRINQRNFGGHRYPRLAHVGDRTGLELIRTLQDHAVYTGHDRAHGAHGHRAAARRRPRRRRAGLRPRARPLPRVRRQGDRAGHRRRRPRLQDHQQQLGRHRRRPRAGVSRRRRADRHGVHPVPSDRDGLAAERARHSRDRRRARRRRRPQEQRRPPLHVRRHPGQLQAADGLRSGRRLALHAGRQERPPSAGAADARPRGALHQPRGQGGARLSARRRVPRHRLDQGEAQGLRGAHQAQAAEHVPPVQGAGGPRHHEGADGGRADHALHHGRHPRGRRHADVDDSRPVRRGRVRVGHQRRQPARRQLAVGPDRVRQARRRVRGRVRRARTAPARVDDGAGRAGDAGRRWRRSSAATAARTRTRCRPTCRTRCRRSSASCAWRARCRRR